MASLDTKMSFTLKDIIFLVTFLASGIGGYITITSDVDQMKKEISALEEANKAYVTLPKEIQDLTIAHEKTAKVVEAIYLGLVANGTIKPPQ